MNSFEEIKRAREIERKALAELHRELGYESSEALIWAILDAVGSTARDAKPSAAQRVSAQPKPLQPQASPLKPRRPPPKSPRNRTQPKGSLPAGGRLPESAREEIRAALRRGETGHGLAFRFGVSYPTIHKIKKAMGLVNERPGSGPRRKK